MLESLENKKMETGQSSKPTQEIIRKHKPLDSKRISFLKFDSWDPRYHFQMIKKRDAKQWEFYTDERGKTDGKRTKVLANAIRSSKKVQRLEITFWECGEIDEEIKTLCRAFENLKPLKSFSIFIGEISSKAMKDLGKSLKKFPRLQSFRLNLYRNWIPNKGFENLGLSLKKLISLQSLAFDYNECEGTGEMGRNSICEGLKNLIKLQKIKLCFQENRDDIYSLSEKEAKSISQALEKLANLQSISLDFSIDREAQDYWLGDLGERLESFIYLKNFNLSLFGCEISDHGLQSLCEGLRNLPSIANISFQFTRCEGLTDDGILIISEIFKNTESLEEIRVGLNDWGRPITEGLKRLKESLEDLVSHPKFVISEGDQEI